MIRPAKISEIDDILTISRACAQHMIAQGIHQWNEFYPSRQHFENDLQRKELFVMVEEDSVLGAIVLSTFMDEEYKAVQWTTPTDNDLYVHRLCIHPIYQGQGKAQEMMAFAEDYAKKHQFTSIRLDTFSQNKRNQQFYEKQGYQRLGDIYFPKQSEAPFHCYELAL